MPVLPALRPFFDAMNGTPRPQTELPPAQARAAMHAMIDATYGANRVSVAPVASERDYRVPVDGGEFTVRVYRPAEAPAPAPCYIHIHGGGFWLGTLEQSDGSCRTLATDVGCVVVSVEYRLAPEAKFPAAAEDSYAALLWVADQADELGVDRSRIAVGGGSAGGNLAAVVALMARDRGGPALVLQVLEIPVTDFTYLEPLSVPEEGIVVPAGKPQYAAHYLADPADATNPYASPLLAADLGRLPPALVMTAEYDALRTEGEAYAKRLADAGAAVEYKCWEGQFHGSQSMATLIPVEAAAYGAQIQGALRRAFRLDAA